MCARAGCSRPNPHQPCVLTRRQVRSSAEGTSPRRTCCCQRTATRIAKGSGRNCFRRSSSARCPCSRGVHVGKPCRLPLVSSDSCQDPVARRRACHCTAAADGFDRGRIRKCGASDCGVYFLDTSKGHRRQWCTMDNCGYREKQRRWRSGTR
jgi:predicted RNA-binding Zn ribbon-like protein